MPLQPFQLLTLVRLVTPSSPPPPESFDADTFKAHIRYLRGLVREGKILANGPAKRIDDPLLRGISLYSVGAEEARALAQLDPAVQAGFFELIVDEWMVPVEPKMIADRTDFEMDVPF